ncbi:MAG: AtpZ/AtpI family protein [Pirellulales bacterium]
MARIKVSNNQSDEPNDGEFQVHPIGRAAEWVSRVLTVVILMVGPGLLGNWLDEKLGTSFLVLLGFVFGLIAGIYYLLVLTKVIKKR